LIQRSENHYYGDSEMSSVKKAFVSEGALSEIVVKVLDDSVIELLEELGFVAVSGK
jgi:hypothetical protein